MPNTMLSADNMFVTKIQNKWRIYYSKKVNEYFHIILYTFALHLDNLKIYSQQFYDLNKKFLLRLKNKDTVTKESLKVDLELIISLQNTYGCNSYIDKYFVERLETIKLKNFNYKKELLHKSFIFVEYFDSENENSVNDFSATYNTTQLKDFIYSNECLEINAFGIIGKGYFIEDSYKVLVNSPHTWYKKEKLLKYIGKKKENKNFLGNWLKYKLCFYNLLCDSSSILLEKLNTNLESFLADKKKMVPVLVKDFLGSTPYAQYNILSLMFLGDDKCEFMGMLLFSLIERESSMKNITEIIYNHLPLQTRKILDERETRPTKHIDSLMPSEIDYEPRICALEASDSVKKKAIEKYREIQNKQGDISKPQQFLDKLLEIPFGIYREESCIMQLQFFLEKTKRFSEEYDSDKIFKPMSWFELENFFDVENEFNILVLYGKDNIIPLIRAFKKSLNIKSLEFKRNGKKQNVQITKKTIDIICSDMECYISQAPLKIKECLSNVIKNLLRHTPYNNILEEWYHVRRLVRDDQKRIRNILDEAIYGQDRAKRCIEQIIGQWMTGNKKGYCFGFEGPPGTGKTSIAKEGICKILQDIDGSYRPFSFIALGGSSHGSLLEGHGYTYSGGTWGQIVNILVSSKCMNPIIFIDELDKVSKTEHGKEIIGILIHLTDPSQNDTFSDRYFADIPLDLSKAIFIFSYNDIYNIDPILRERIHRIQFTHFRHEEKCVICNEYILPKLYQTVGLSKEDVILNDDVLMYIIKNYTFEAGLRRISQLLLEILREINLQFLNNEKQRPLTLTCEDIKNDLLKQYTFVQYTKLLNEPRVGSINGLFATSVGMGGITRIEIQQYSELSGKDTKFEITGHLGKVMTESISVAKTVVYNILSEKSRKDIAIKTKELDYHIHCCEGAVPKDGPSAGTAISVAMLSCVLKIPISNTIAITGEIDIHGYIHAIGGLSDKVWGAQLAGIEYVFCPKENEEDMNRILDKVWYTGKTKIILVHHICDDELLNKVFTKNIKNKIMKK